jgi:SlyX protein
MSGTDDRVTELEIALSHQQAMLDELSEVVHRQAEELTVLRRALVQLRDRLLEAGQDDAPPPSVDRPPPHW